MNLFYDTSAMSLRQLIGKASKSTSTHNVVVDYDGEVIIDPELHFAGVDLSKYKYRTQIASVDKTNERSLNALLNALLAGYNGGELHIHQAKNFRKAA